MKTKNSTTNKKPIRRNKVKMSNKKASSGECKTKHKIMYSGQYCTNKASSGPQRTTGKNKEVGLGDKTKIKFNLVSSPRVKTKAKTGNSGEHKTNTKATNSGEHNTTIKTKKAISTAKAKSLTTNKI